MKQGLFTIFLCAIGLLCIGAGSKSKAYLVTFHMEGDETDSTKFVTPVKLGSEYRQYFFKTMPSFTDKDFLWFYPFVSEDGQSYGAAFRLNDVKAQELTAITIENQGRLFGTRVLDAPLTAVIIDRPINDGVVVIWKGLSQNHLKLIGSRIQHVEAVEGAMNTPSFDLPPGQQSQTQNQPQTNTGTSGKRRPFGKLFGNGFLKKNQTPPPANPYANTPQ